MALRVSSFTIPIGTARALSIAWGEDREYRLAYTDGGAAIDMASVTDLILYVVNPVSGQQILARPYAGFYATGVPRFQISTVADFGAIGPGSYLYNVIWQDAAGYKTQMGAASQFNILPGFN